MTHSCCKRGDIKMAGLQGVLLRTSIVLGMVVAVVTILYLQPVPDQIFKSCDRPCHELDWPMICRVKLTLEQYRTMSGSCEDCPNNLTHCNNPNCVSADGIIRSIVTANRQVPGPAIHVCKNDVLVVDIINKMPGSSVTVHWRGQPQHEAPFMDGVPLVTQCPIPSYTTFQYKFRASAAGTHYWHAHSGSNRANGFFGALVVRQPERLEPLRKFYDIDDKDHFILISEWGNERISDGEAFRPKSLLINGKAPSSLGNTLATFNVEKGKRYRFRVAYTGGVMGCPVNISIDNHLLKIVALDGNPTNAHEASQIVLSKGERVDFILKTNQDPAAYIIRVNSECSPDVLEGLGILNYQGVDNDKARISDVMVDAKDDARKFTTKPCIGGIGQVCLGNVHSLKKMPTELRGTEVGRTIYLPFDYKLTEEMGESYLSDLRIKIHRMNNMTFTYPSSPLLTQMNDVNYKTLCNGLTIPERCSDADICECVHVEYIPLDASVEILLVDQGGDVDEHVFHLHGYNFYVVGSTQFDEPVSIDEIKDLDRRGKLFKRNLVNAVQKDTVRVPRFGAVAIRFIAKNPGFWMLRDEHARQWTRGLDIVFQVGVSNDMVPTPTNFPTCGSWVGPDFFLV